MSSQNPENTFDSKLLNNTRGGTDLVEILMIVSLLGLGLVGAITLFGDSFEDQTDEVGDAVTRMEALQGSGTGSVAIAGNAATGGISAASLELNNGGAAGGVGSAGGAIGYGIGGYVGNASANSSIGTTSTTSSDVVLVRSDALSLSATNSTEGSLGSSLQASTDAWYQSFKNASGVVVGANGVAASSGTSISSTARAVVEAAPPVKSANELLGIENAHGILDSDFCQVLRGQTDGPQFVRKGRSKSDKKVRQKICSNVGFVEQNHPEGTMDQYALNLLSCRPSDTKCQKNNAYAAAMAALGFPLSNHKSVNKAFRRIHDMIEGGYCGRSGTEFCDMWSEMTREERIAYFGFGVEQWNTAANFLKIYKNGYRAAVDKRQAGIKQAVGLALNFIPGVGTTLSAVWNAGVAIEQGGDVLGALVGVGAALLGAQVDLGTIGGLPITGVLDGNRAGICLGGAICFDRQHDGDICLSGKTTGASGSVCDDGTVTAGVTNSSGTTVGISHNGVTDETGVSVSHTFENGVTASGSVADTEHGLVGTVGASVTDKNCVSPGNCTNTTYNGAVSAGPNGVDVTGGVNRENVVRDGDTVTRVSSGANVSTNGNVSASRGTSTEVNTGDTLVTNATNVNVSGNVNTGDASASVANSSSNTTYTEDEDGRQVVANSESQVIQGGLAVNGGKVVASGSINQSDTHRDDNGDVTVTNIGANGNTNGDLAANGSRTTIRTDDAGNEVVTTGTVNADTESGVAVSGSQTTTTEDGETTGVYAGADTKGGYDLGLVNDGGRCGANEHGINLEGCEGFVVDAAEDFHEHLANAEELAANGEGEDLGISDDAGCTGGNNSTQRGSGHALGTLPKAIMATGTANTGLDFGPSTSSDFCSTAHLNDATDDQKGALSVRLINIVPLVISANPNDLEHLNLAQLEEINSILDSYSGQMQFPNPERDPEAAAQFQADRERIMDLLAAGGQFEYKDSDGDGVRNFQEGYLAEYLSQTWDGIKDYGASLARDPDGTLIATADSFAEWARGETDEFLSHWCSPSNQGNGCANDPFNAARLYINQNINDAWDHYQQLDAECRGGNDQACVSREGIVFELQVGALTAGAGLSAKAVRSAIPDAPPVNLDANNRIEVFSDSDLPRGPVAGTVTGGFGRTHHARSPDTIPEGFGERTDPKDVVDWKVENDNADLLREHGFDIYQNPGQRIDNDKKPDYLVNGRYADLYYPETNTSPRNLRSKVAERKLGVTKELLRNKVEPPVDVNRLQANTVVMDLGRWNGSVEQAVAAFKKKPVADWGLDELIIISKEKEIFVFDPSTWPTK